jgi:hypothetical protein
VFTDRALLDIVAALKSQAERMGMTRQRSGSARGVHWAEISGRVTDGSWAEMRLHHRPDEHRLQAGLLLYQPLMRGGRTHVVGEQSLTYGTSAAERADELTEEIGRWLTRIGGDGGRR